MSKALGSHITPGRDAMVIALPASVWREPGKKMFQGFCDVCGAMQITAIYENGGADVTEHDRDRHQRRGERIA